MAPGASLACLSLSKDQAALPSDVRFHMHASQPPSPLSQALPCVKQKLSS